LNRHVQDNRADLPLVETPQAAHMIDIGAWESPRGAIFALTGTSLGPSRLQRAKSYPFTTTQGLGGTTIQVNIPVPRFGSTKASSPLS
jgi:hypothetical protein